MGTNIESSKRGGVEGWSDSGVEMDGLLELLFVFFFGGVATSTISGSGF